MWYFLLGFALTMLALFGPPLLREWLQHRREVRALKRELETELNNIKGFERIAGWPTYSRELKDKALAEAIELRKRRANRFKTKA